MHCKNCKNFNSFKYQWDNIAECNVSLSSILPEYSTNDIVDTDYINELVDVLRAIDSNEEMGLSPVTDGADIDTSLVYWYSEIIFADKRVFGHDVQNIKCMTDKLFDTIADIIEELYIINGNTDNTTGKQLLDGIKIKCESVAQNRELNCRYYAQLNIVNGDC